MDYVDLVLQHSQYAVPVGIVVILAVLVFACGFKKAEQPPFAQLSAVSDVDRKLARKRGKTREKRATDGQVNSEKTSPIKKTAAKAEASRKTSGKGDEIDGKLKENKQDDNVATRKEKEQPATKAAGKENKLEQIKNKKNLKHLYQEKPVDFDDGDWEQAYSRKDKKNKKKEEESPSKRNKKTAKKTDLINEVKQKEQEKPEIKDKTVKETENKELQEKEKKEVILSPVSNEELDKTKEAQQEEQTIERKEEQSKVPLTREKNEKVEKEEKKSGKSKKNKKPSESENTPTTVPSTPKSDNNEPVKPDESQKRADKVAEKAASSTEEDKTHESKEKNAAVFDELGDVWTEAKPQKKSKKKARRDN